jgi:aldehyde:ferredoxin oxidoreductase
VALKSGYFRSRLHVDLSAGTAERIPLADGFLERFIGGRGFGAKIVWDALAAHGFSIDPLGPENTLAIAGGPLTGMYLPSSGKCSFVTISPATGVYGDSSMGGSFGIELRQAGVDVLDITGKAPVMSFLFVDDGEASIVPFPELAGKTCLEAEGLVKERLGTHEVHVASIGVGGEKLVRFACVGETRTPSSGSSTRSRTARASGIRWRTDRAASSRGGPRWPKWFSR